MKKTLLDLDRVPTLEELRAFFKENDWSTATYRDIDYEKMDTEEIESLEYIKGLMDKHWEPLSQEMGLKSGSANYGKDNPLIAMRDNLENLVATGVMKLLDEQPEKVDEILSHFFTEEAFENPEQFDKNADDFLHNAVDTVMQTMNYEEIAKIINSSPAYEDFNHNRSNNFRAKDFDRKWNHTRAKMKTTSLDEMQEKAFEDSGEVGEVIADTKTDIENEVIAKITKDTFWNSISEQDRELLKMRMNGMSQKEIAEKLGYKTHSAVTKRLQKLKEQFLKSE